MMKHTGAIALGLGLFTAVPALTFGGDLPTTIETALGETVRAIEVLSKLDKRVQAGESIPIHTVTQVTEAPIGDERTREERRMELRDEVSALQTQLDTKKLSSGMPLIGVAHNAINMGATGSNSGGMPGLNTNNVSSGLSPTFIRALGAGQGVGAGSHSKPSLTASVPMAGPQQSMPLETSPSGSLDGSTTSASPITTTVSPEGSGYSANPLLQAQACYRAGRYAQGVELLAGVDPSPVVNYWKARLYEKVGRTAEAIRMYEKVETNDQSGSLRVSAQREREFAEWRLNFEKKTGLVSGDSK